MSSISLIPEKVITLVIHNLIVFPDNELTITLAEEQGSLIHKLMLDNESKNVATIIAIATKKAEFLNSTTSINLKEIYNIGCLGNITSIMPIKGKKIFQLRLRTLPLRFNFESIVVDSQNLLYISTGKSILDNDLITNDTANVNKTHISISMIAKLLTEVDQLEQFESYPELINLLNQKTLESYVYATNILCFSLNFFSLTEKNNMLESKTLSERLELIIKALSYKISQIVELKNIQTKTLNDMQKSQKEYVLREQMKNIKKELGENDDNQDDFEKKVKKTSMPLEIRKIADEEYKRFTQLNPASADYHVIKNYLEWLMAIPWSKSTKDNIDISKARNVLNEDHYGLEVVKKRILEFLSISNLRGSFKGQTLCLVGPPGVGKTSLVKSIAKAVGRKYSRIALGGVHDESEIRGHRRTYVGSMPGKIVQQLKKVGVNNPIILLDEIDKLGRSSHGDPSSALLEVLDPEQNNSFNDHFINASIDLSNVFFIATANSLDDIPAPLRDRMDIIQLGSYTHTEKAHIVKNHLIKKMTSEYCLENKNIIFEDTAINKIINDYTREAGVRDLQRKIGSIFRFIAQEFVENIYASVIINEEKVKEILGRETVSHESSMENGEVGIASGLAWTSVGGEMLFIESNFMPGNGHLKLTGSLGDVMKESAQIAMSYIKANAKELGIVFDFAHNDIHLHFPSGAIPKDGPSAGIAICSCLVSLFKNEKLSNKIAMTGEISLRGKVLPVGGIKEKVIAAHRAGITQVLLPKENEGSAMDIPDEVKKDLEILYVSTFNEVMTKILQK